MNVCDYFEEKMNDECNNCFMKENGECQGSVVSYGGLPIFPPCAELSNTELEMDIEDYKKQIELELIKKKRKGRIRMNEELERMYELIKGHNFVFLDESFIDAYDIEDEIDNCKNMYMCDDEEFITVPVYKAIQVDKPNLSINDIGELLEGHEYNTEDEWSTDLVKDDKETLAKINELIHTLILPIYISGVELFSIKIYADADKGFEIVEGGKKDE